MSDYLGNLATRVLLPDTVLRPRLPGRFEPWPAVEGLVPRPPLEVEERAVSPFSPVLVEGQGPPPDSSAGAVEPLLAAPPAAAVASAFPPPVRGQPLGRRSPPDFAADPSLSPAGPPQPVQVEAQVPARQRAPGAAFPSESPSLGRGSLVEETTTASGPPKPAGPRRRRESQAPTPPLPEREPEKARSARRGARAATVNPVPPPAAPDEPHRTLPELVEPVARARPAPAPPAVVRREADTEPARGGRPAAPTAIRREADTGPARAGRPATAQQSTAPPSPVGEGARRAPPAPAVVVAQTRVAPTRFAEPPKVPVAEAPPPAIQVTIGRIEVRAAPAAVPPKKQAAAQPALSLEEYLRRRKGETR